MKKSMLIVSHDSGGAEVLSAWVKKNTENHYTFVLAGPAISIFSNRLGSIDNHPEEALENLVSGSDFVLTATSWLSDIERKAIRYSKKYNITSASYLDHWIHYKERFLTNGTMELPSEIWVGDEYAQSKANSIFYLTFVLYMIHPKNPHFTTVFFYQV